MRRYVLLLAVLCFTTGAWAQFRISNFRNNRQNNRSNSSNGRKFYFALGGGFGSGTNSGYNSSGNSVSALGLRYTYYSLLPTLGYRVQPNVLVGVNVSYSKYSFPDIGYSYDQFGVAPFVRYYVQQVFFQLEYDKISSTTLDNEPRKYYDRLLVGLGYAQPLGKRSTVNALVMYDLIYQQNGVFQSPVVVRVFFAF